MVDVFVDDDVCKKKALKTNDYINTTCMGNNF
jgi:hypothetical protein